MTKPLTILKHRLTTLREIYVIPTDAAIQTRSEIRRIVKTLSFESHVADLRYEELESATALSK